MGRLISPPKPKAAATTPSVAQSITAAATTTTTTAANTGTTPTEASPTEIAKARAENVARRARSLLGTVVTGFRGLLGQSSGGTAPQRKSLLGE